MTNTVTPETARLLAAAGFPQPAPAPGQWWGDEKRLFCIFRKWDGENEQYFTVVEALANSNPIIDRYFDARDFCGLVYLPTVGDILRELPGYAVGRYNVSKSAFDSPEMAWLCVSSQQKEFRHEHLSEAAALAYLSIHEKK